MSKHEMEVQAECDSCSGTGLYVGMAEHDGIAVQCSMCKGRGEVTKKFVWRDFEGRRDKPGVLRVLHANPGISTGAGNGYTIEHFGGLPVEAWKRGEPFAPGTEMRAFTCPAWWYQSADSNKKPNWNECGWGAFSRCPHFSTKAKCWERWDKENNA